MSSRFVERLLAALEKVLMWMSGVYGYHAGGDIYFVHVPCEYGTCTVAIPATHGESQKSEENREGAA